MKDCALLFATPVSREEFDEAARPDRVSDYLAGQFRGRTAAELWAEQYRNTADTAQQLDRTARELGVAVFRRATLADFAKATCLYGCIIVFAHWRGVIYRESDFQVDAREIANRIRCDAILRSIRFEQTGVQPLLDALNAAVTSMSLLDTLPAAIAADGRRTPVLGRTLCRDLIDERLYGMVKPGNRMEFADGLHTPSDVERALCSTFNGELDLAMCNSAALATVIDLRRGSRLRHLHWPQYLLPEPQYLKVEWTLREMAATGGYYIPTRLSVEAREPGRDR
jgi:hypothetical protein